jgi:hypothetical protein
VSYANGVAFVVACCPVGVLPDSISSVVASSYLRCGVFFLGMATASGESKFKVAHNLFSPQPGLEPATVLYFAFACVAFEVIC